MNILDLSKFLYCRNCGMKTQHYRDLRHSWGYSCRICQTWQHESQLIEIQLSFAAKMILASMADNDLYYADGTLQDFIEAVESLSMDYDYQKTDDGYDFKAWYPDNQETFARIKL
jgi:hypothetical protein